MKDKELRRFLGVKHVKSDKYDTFKENNLSSHIPKEKLRSGHYGHELADIRRMAYEALFSIYALCEYFGLEIKDDGDINKIHGWYVKKVDSKIKPEVIVMAISILVILGIGLMFIMGR